MIPADSITASLDFPPAPLTIRTSPPEIFWLAETMTSMAEPSGYMTVTSYKNA